MKNFILITFLFSLISGFAQNGKNANNITILPLSELLITGDTNINSFKCNYNSAALERSKQIKHFEKDGKILFENAILILENTGFDCGNKAINKDFHSLLQSAKYPEISLQLNTIEVLKNNTAKAHISIKIAGITKNYTLPISITSNPVDCFMGTLHLDINDFNLEPPKKMFGLIVLKEDIEITFNLSVKK